MHFQELVAIELGRARHHHPPMRSLHEGYAIALEEFDELRAEVWKKPAKRSKRKLLTEAVQLAAMIQRLAEDCILPMNPQGE